MFLGRLWCKSPSKTVLIHSTEDTACAKHYPLLCPCLQDLERPPCQASLTSGIQATDDGSILSDDLRLTQTMVSRVSDCQSGFESSMGVSVRTRIE